ncbi:SUKH-3 domain-containing protein [Streptomyces sp. NPDC046716]|uniref:SUKH-3 domain-containing protein n=1 Tax=Streptomyces sp. NPDC046716 TaxID=3157093 RepID=UPI0033D9474C
MPVLKSPVEVDAWLTDAGWYPGRRCDELAAAEIADAQEAFREDGSSLDIIPPALDFLREHIGLVAPLNSSNDDKVEFFPFLTYRGAGEDIQELADALRKKVFPVAYDTYDVGTVLIDEASRFFYQHWSGVYFLGDDKYSALMNYSRGYPLPYADPYYVW